jgi:hypothetical protein
MAKDRHRRRPPVDATVADQSRGRGGGFNDYDDEDDDDDDDEDDEDDDGRGRTGFGGRGMKRRPTRPSNANDPWKVLIKKLDTTKSAKDKFGKVEVAPRPGTTIVDELRCPHFATCGGCSMTGNFSDAPIIKRAKAFFAAENLRFPTHVGNVTHWRTHVKLAVRPLSRWGGLKIGLFKAGSHEVEAIPDCRVHHPRINEAVEVRTCLPSPPVACA